MKTVENNQDTWLTNETVPARYVNAKGSKLKNDWPLNAADRNLFYGGTQHGYTDYPVYS